MSDDMFELDAEVREDIGKGASRRLRREQGKIPGIIYGGKGKPTPITLEHRQVFKALENEAFYSHILTVKVDKKAEKVILKDLQRHVYKPKVLHMDFQRVTASQKLTTTVPLHFLNESTAAGVKEGGSIHHSMNELEVSCLPKNLPEYIEVDLADVEIGTILHISDVKLPKGVESVALAYGSDHDLPVVSINAPRVASESSSEDGEESAEASED